MKVIPFVYNAYDDLISNTYVVMDNKNQCVIIDPGCAYQGIVNYVKKNNLIPKAILLTHGHFDHMRGVDIFEKEYNVPLYIGYKDLDNLKDFSLNCSLDFEEGVFEINTPGIGVSENDVLDLLEEKIYIIETPFHTRGSICFYLKDSGILFSGDTLFKQGIGRTDLKGGNARDVYPSLKKLFALNGNVKVYPGHGPSTLIENERMLNYL